MMDRRRFLASGGLALSYLATRPGWARPLAAKPARGGRPTSPGALHQSVCRWPFAGIPLEQFCGAVARLGLEAIDLLYPDEWDVAREHGLAVSMGFASRRARFITEGFNRVALHDVLVEELETAIPQAARAGVEKLIVMSGNRDGQPERQGIRACIQGLRRVVPTAERHGVTLCLEMLNSTVDHPDYDADSTRYGLEVAQGVGSGAFKLLYDIYHMQIMEGDVIATLRSNVDVIAHLHTAGVPGRHELDDTQELNYRGIAAALADLGFEGYVAHEFVPTRDPLGSLRQAAEVCTV